MLLQHLLSNKKNIYALLLLLFYVPLSALQLGDGSDTCLSTPMKVFSNVKSVFPSEYSTYVITKDNSLWVSGSKIDIPNGSNFDSYGNYFQQIDENVIECKKYYGGEYIVKVTGELVLSNKTGQKILDTEVLHVSVGDSGDVLYIKKDKTLWGYGINQNGQLCLGHTNRVETPVLIMKDIFDVYTGFSTTKILTLDGKLWVSTEEGSVTKIADDVISITEDMFVTKDNKLFCFGREFFGRGGLGSYSDLNFPITMVMENVKEVSSSVYHTLILTLDGKVYSCGGDGGSSLENYSSFGFIGNGSLEPQNRPVFIMDNIANVAVSDFTSFAVDNDGNLWAWGLNNDNELLLFY